MTVIYSRIKLRSQGVEAVRKHILSNLALIVLLISMLSGCLGGTVTETVTSLATTKTVVKTTTVTVQTEAIEEGWIRLDIKDVGSIEYPVDFLELQSEDYQNLGEEFRQTWELLVPDFTLQQVGLNAFEPSAFLEFRRVMFFTEYLNPGEEVLRADEREILSELEIDILETFIVEQLKQEFQAMGISLVEPISLEIKEVNGMYPLVHTYIRQLDDNPVVLVQSYMFQNYDMIHYLIFSHRVEDEAECKDIYDQILASFRLYEH